MVFLRFVLMLQQQKINFHLRLFVIAGFILRFLNRRLDLCLFIETECGASEHEGKCIVSFF